MQDFQSRSSQELVFRCISSRSHICRVTVGPGLLVVPVIIIFSTPSCPQKCPDLNNKVYINPVFLIDWTFPEYKLVRSLAPSLISQELSN